MTHARALRYDAEPGRRGRGRTCKNCGNSLDPLEWETLDDEDPVDDAEDTGYSGALRFCDEEGIAEWKRGR
jgi:hypothetical protein